MPKSLSTVERRHMIEQFYRNHPDGALLRQLDEMMKKRVEGKKRQRKENG